MNLTEALMSLRFERKKIELAIQYLERYVDLRANTVAAAARDVTDGRRTAKPCGRRRINSTESS